MVHVPDETTIDDLAFPHARIVDMVKAYKKNGQFVRKHVYFGLNILLHKIADEIIREMVKTEKAYIEKHDLDRASQKFENVELILKEKKRIIAHLGALKEDVDKLARDLERAEITTIVSAVGPPETTPEEPRSLDEFRNEDERGADI